MSLPLWYLLIPLAAVVIFSGFFLLFNLFDMGTYGIQSGNTKFIISLYVGGFLAILLFTGMNLAFIDWSASLDLSSLLPGMTSNANTLGL